MVVVSPVRSGQVAPETEFVGTVHFPEISDVAAEVEGRIATVNIEDGDRVRSGQVLVRLNADLLEKSIQGQSASHEEILADLKKARSDLARMEALFHRGAIQEQLYEEHRFRVLSLQSKADSVRTDQDYLAWEVFGNRAVRQGEWKLRWQIKPYGKSDWELFNVAQDPAERKDVAAQNPGKVKAMTALWDDYVKVNNVILPNRTIFDTLEKDMPQRVQVYPGFPPLIYQQQFVPPKEMLADPKP